MKILITLILCLTYLSSIGQEISGYDEHQWEAPYYLPSPKDWGGERFPVPPSFSPSIPYYGIEDIRFMPGWSNNKSNEYWSYAFLWFLDDVKQFDSKILEKDLTAYYEGLFNVNSDKSKHDTSQFIPVKVSINPKRTVKGDHKTFVGAIEMNDYKSSKPINLNVMIHIKFCEGLNKTIAFFQLSPMPFDHSIWNSLNQLWLNFKCTKY